jgi:transposase
MRPVTNQLMCVKNFKGNRDPEARAMRCLNSLGRDGELVSEPQDFRIGENHRIIEHARKKHNGKPA